MRASPIVAEFSGSQVVLCNMKKATSPYPTLKLVLELLASWESVSAVMQLQREYGLYR